MNNIQKVRNNSFLRSRCKDFMQKYGIKTMQAWQAFDYGGTDKLQLNTVTQIPIIKSPLDVLVKVHATSINPLDVQMLEGYGAATFNFVRQVNRCSLTSQEFPLVLGRDFSGTVVHVGKKVKSIKCGDEVWGASSPWHYGSHAEFALSSVCYVSKKPSSVNHTEAASIPYAGLTAWTALTCFGGLSEKSSYNKRVLVTGASGGVGTFAIQILKAWGAEVTATCSTDAVEMVQNLGADNVLNYQDPDFKRQLKELKGFDVILDNVGKDYPALSINLLKSWKNTKYVSLVSPLLKNADDNGIVFGTLKSGVQAVMDTVMSVKDGTSFRWAYFMPNGCVLNTISKMIDNKQIVPVIDKTYSFNDVPKAYEKVSSGHSRGKVVIDLFKDSSVVDINQI